MDITTDGSEHVNKSALANRLGVSVDKLDFGYIESCKNAEELEKILKVLRSGEEGCFPHLENKTEERLQALKPKSRLLRKEEHVLKSSDLRPEDSSAVKEDLSNWARDMSLKDLQLKQEPPSSAPSRPISKELPPVRNANANAIKISSKGDNEVVTNKPSQKPSAPKNYREWDKIISEIDTEAEVPDSSTPSPATLASASASLSKSGNLKDTIDCTGMSDLQKEQLNTLEKDKGNEALRAGSYAEAMVYYCRSISVLPTVAAHNNRALAYIKLEKWSEAICDCNYVLSREARDIKALLRRATAFRGQRKYNEAKADIDVVLACEPNNKQAQELLTSISRHVVKEESERKPGVPRRMVIEETDGEESDDEMSSTLVDSNEPRGSMVSEPTELCTTPQEPPCATASSGRVVEGAEGKDANKPRQPHLDLAAPLGPAIPDRPDSTAVALDQSYVNPSVPASPLPIVDPKENTVSSAAEQPVTIVVAPLPSNVAALSSKAGVLFKAGQYGDAKGLYDQAIMALSGGDSDHGPMHTNSYHLSSLYSNRAACYFKMGDPRKCVSDCSAALQLVPHSPRALMRRAQAYEQLEKFADAFVDYRHYLSRITVDGSVGDVTTAQQGASRCQVCLQQLHGSAWRDRIPKIPSVSNLLAYEFESSEDESLKRSPAGKTLDRPVVGENITETGEPAKRYTTYESAKNDGNDFFKKGKYQEAVKCYTAGIKLAPDQAVCYSNRAECFLKLNQPQPAADDADAALRLDPDNVKALFRYARACKGLGNLSKSRELMERLLQLDRNNKDAQKELQTIVQALSAKHSQSLKTTEVTDKNYQSSSEKPATVGMRVKIDETTSDESDTETTSSVDNSSSEGSDHLKAFSDPSVSRTVNGQTAGNESQIAFNNKPNLGSASRVSEDFHAGQDTSGQEQPATVLLKGRQLFDAGLLDEAIDVYTGAIDSYQGLDVSAAEAVAVSSLYYGRASCHLQKCNSVACLADCESALKLAPADDRPARLRERAAMLQKQTDCGRTAPAASFQSAPPSEPLSTVDSSVHAREHAQVEGRCGPRDANAETSGSLTLGYEEIKEKGRKLVAEGNFQKALELYSEGIRKFGADTVLFNNRAFCHLRLEHFADAVADCRVVLRSEPNNTKALFRLGRAEKCLGNYQSSMKTLNQALQLDKCNKEIAQELDSVKDLYRRHLEVLKSNGSTSAACSKDSPSGGLSAGSKFDAKRTLKKATDATASAALHRVGASGDALSTSQSRAAETADETPAKDRCPLSHRKSTGKVASTMANTDVTPSCKVPSFENGSVRSDDNAEALGEQMSTNGTFDIPKRPVPERARFAGARKPVRVTPASFVQEWHRIKSLKGTLPYADLLRKISPGDIPEAVTNQIDGDMLSKVVSTLKDHFISSGEDSKTAYDILENISRVSRFNMAKEFLSSTDKRNLDEIVKAFTHFGIETSATSVLRRSYGI